MVSPPKPCSGFRDAAIAISMAAAGLVASAPILQAAEPAPPTRAPARASSRSNLDLRLGDLRRYIEPGELYAPLPEDFGEVVVSGRRRPPDIPDNRTIPQGLGGVFFALSRPLSAWRVLVPDPHYEIPKREVDSPREPPGAFRMRLSASPGSIFN
jgi:hypothetical protein